MDGSYKMHFLIYLLTFTVGAFINNMIGYATGIKVGAALLYIADYFIAKELCKLYDEKKAKKQALQVNICAKCGSTISEGDKFCTKCGAKVEPIQVESFCELCEIKCNHLTHAKVIDIMSNKYMQVCDQCLTKSNVEKTD